MDLSEIRARNTFDLAALQQWQAGDWSPFPSPLWGAVTFDRITHISMSDEMPHGIVEAEICVQGIMFPTDHSRVAAQLSGFFGGWADVGSGTVVFDHLRAPVDFRGGRILLSGKTVRYRVEIMSNPRKRNGIVLAKTYVSEDKTHVVRPFESMVTIHD